VVEPWLCRVVEVIMIWTVATQGYGNFFFFFFYFFIKLFDSY